MLIDQRWEPGLRGRLCRLDGHRVHKQMVAIERCDTSLLTIDTNTSDLSSSASSASKVVECKASGARSAHSDSRREAEIVVEARSGKNAAWR